ncbi:MAG: glucose-1-phosphate thymidylyltransferase [Actinomycetota bacterium]|nr:glucose-1-phosphate thymidylyltransferase [Actinomycetota bacterium]
MKGLVLAGGSGTRLRPITSTSAKQLVPVANKPILFYGLESLAESGIREVGIIVGDTAEEVSAAVGDGKRWGLDVTYLPQAAPLGLAHCVLVARDFLGGDDFVMYLGDNLLTQGIDGFVEAFETERGSARAAGRQPPVAQILLARVPDPHRFGVAELDASGRVVRLVEKPVDPPSDLALVGVYLFDSTIHQAVAAIRPSARGELEITDAIQWLLENGHRVNSQVVQGYWKDLGQREALLEGNRLVLESVEPRVEGLVDAESRLEGRVVVEQGARIVRSVVRGPAIVGEGSVVEDSFVGPFTSIYRDCRIVRSEIEHSVVMASATIVDIGRLVDSLIGNRVTVARNEQRPKALRLMLGDHSRVDLA